MCLQVNASTIDGVTPLFNACTVGSVACAEILLENGAKPQSLVYHPSPIHEATSKGIMHQIILHIRQNASNKISGSFSTDFWNILRIQTVLCCSQSSSRQIIYAINQYQLYLHC